MKKNVFMMMAVAGLLFTSCASKKQLLECQTQNQTLTSDLQSVKEELAAKNVRVASLEEQLAAQKQTLEEQKKAYTEQYNMLVNDPNTPQFLLRNIRKSINYFN